MDEYYSGPTRTGGLTRPNFANSLYENVPDQRSTGPSGDKLTGFKRPDSRVSVSLASTGKLTDSQNPYSLYDSIDNDSLDDGIHMDISPGDQGMGNMFLSSNQPSEDVVLREFSDYMDVMLPMSDPEFMALQNTTVDEKWTLITNQRNRSPVFNVRYYIENLKQNQGTKRKRFSIGKSQRPGSSGLGYVLHKLKLDLKMSPTSFLSEFMKDSNNGLHLLVQILKEIQRDRNILNTARKTKKDEMEKSMEDEEDCLLCLRFLLRIEDGVRRMAKEEGVYDMVAQTILSPKARCRTVALKILTLLARSAASEFRHIIEAMNRLKLKLNEDVLFRTLCNIFNARDSGGMYLPFLTATVRFFNTLVFCANNASARVHLQHELEMAGFKSDDLEGYSAITDLNVEEVLKPLDLPADSRADIYSSYSRGTSFAHDELSQELDKWKANYIDVATMKDERTTLESRNKLLRDEVSRMEEQLKTLERLVKQGQKERKKVDDRSEEYRERAAELQDTVERLRKMYEDNLGRAVDNTALNVEEVLKPLDLPADSRADIYSSVRSMSTISNDVPDAPPLPPAPPLPQMRKKAPSPSVALPLLNWTPLQKVQNTIFQDIDDDAVYRELDLSDFELQFKLQRRPETETLRERRKKLSHPTDRLHFVDLNRAKNISITKHRTGMTSREIKDAIESCDIKLLPGEYAELLIKFIPTKEEIKLLSQHKDEYWKMGEAEQFLFQLAQVERLESKLSILAFVGIFDELVHTVKPNISRILEASNSVLRSQGLRKAFEIILAFGNFMNGSKRGYVYGFRLESLSKLSDIKSADKQMTLMHYLVEHIQRNYPEFANVYEDLNLNIDKSASYHALGQDVVCLRKGIDLVKFEKDKQGNNRSLSAFYSTAAVQVAEIAEHFKKMEESYKEVCTSMGENYKMIEPSSFFGLLTKFFNDYEKAHRDILKRSTERLPPPTKAYKAQKQQTKKAAPAPPKQKKEAPKILQPLTPVAASVTKPLVHQKTEHRGPVTGQHVLYKTTIPDTASTNSQQIAARSMKTREAPEPPPDYPMESSKKQVTNGPPQPEQGYSKKYPAVKRHSTKDVQSTSNQRPQPTPLKAGQGRANGHAHGGNVVNGDQPDSGKINAPTRGRTESEAFRAEVSDALAQLDQAVEFGESMDEQEEPEPLCSRL